jgi:hypothetical protein
MPYVGEAREKELIESPKIANCDGDYNALFTMAYLKAYIETPKYATIAKIRKSSMQPQYLTEVKDVEDLLTVQGVTIMDRIVARDLAFVEFYDRVGRPHENLAKRKNGDIQLYKEADKVLHGKALELVQGKANE